MPTVETKEVLDSSPIELLGDIVLYILKGIAGLITLALLYIFGKYRKQHEELYEWHKENNSDAIQVLKDKILIEEKEAQKKYQKDVADLKHEFAQIKLQIAPLLKKMSEEENVLDEIKSMIKNLQK